MPNVTSGAYSQPTDRRPAAAGTFYPADPKTLRAEIEKVFQESTVTVSQHPRMLISPHAGYIFSGGIAARGYAHIDSSIKRVIIIGPSHYQAFSGVAFPEVQWYETPLGKVKIDQDAVNTIKMSKVARPASGADIQEHCIEVQLPFLQVKLKDFTIVPLITGRINPSDLAQVLIPLVNDTTLVVASSDLSHYHIQSDARKIDDMTISAIIGNVSHGEIDGCGETAIRTVMALGEHFKLTPVLLEKKTSFETAPAHCSSNKVVGYASIMFVKPQEKTVIAPSDLSVETEEFSTELRAWMLQLGRESLTAAVQNNPPPSLSEIPQPAKDMRGCFITLTKKGALRGCIGYIEPVKPLYQAIIENARNAALNDHRFSPVKQQELSDITLEVSVLTKPEPLAYQGVEDLLSKIHSGIDGVILTKDHRQSTFLPQVWEQLPQKVDFLEHLAVKAGLNRDDWKTAEYKIYHVVHFQEKSK